MNTTLLDNLNQEELKQLLAVMTPAEKALLTLNINQRRGQLDGANRLLDFCCLMDPGYKPEIFHATIATHLEAIERREINKLIIASPPQHGKCAHSNSLVNMSDGSLKKIYQIEEGDLVLTTNEKTYKSEVSRVKSKICNGVKPVYRYLFHSGRYFDCTLNHPMMSVDGWKEAREFTAGSKVLAYKKVEAAESEPMPEHIAYLLGYIVGDGGFTEKSVIFTSGDCDVLEHFRYIADCLGFITPFTNEKKISVRLTRKNKNTETAEALLLKYMEHGNSHTKLVSPSVFKGTLKDKAEFLAAYFNCDGTVNLHSDGNCEYYSVNRELLSQVQHLLSFFGIYSRLQQKKGKYLGQEHLSWRLTINGQDAVRFAKNIPVIGEKGHKLQQLAKRLIDRKSAQYHEAVPTGWHKYLTKTETFYRKKLGVRFKTKNVNGTDVKVVRKLAEIEGNEYLLKVTQPHLYWDKIVSIEYIGEEEVWDIEVENHHNFLVNNILVHNSTLGSEFFPAWHIGRRPDSPIAIVSYNNQFVLTKGRKARSYVKSREYGEIFPNVKLSEESQAVEQWNIIGHKGFVKSVGWMGGITGNGIHLGIIDDIIEGAEDAGNQNTLDKQWEWFQGDFVSRLWPGAIQIIIGTRWVEDDLTGRVLNSPGGSEWVVLRFPAISETQEERDRNNAKYNLPPGLPDATYREPGEALAPVFRPLDFLEEKKRFLGSRVWAAMWQGSPTAAEGNIIKRSWLENSIVDYVPSPEKEGVYRVRAWDLAGTDGNSKNGKKADYTVGALLTYDTNTELIYIEDIVRGRWSSGARNDVMEQTAKDDLVRAVRSWKKGNVYIWHEQQPGAAGKDTMEEINQRLRKIAGFDFVNSQPASGSKELRFNPFAAHAEHGKIRIKKAPWNETLIDEMCNFPVGSHDDICDAVSLAFNKLILMKKKKKLTVK